MIDLMRTTLDIEDDVLSAAKELAAAQGKTAGQVVSELVRRGLQASAATGRKRAVRNGVPLIRRGADAPVLTLALVNELRDEG